jgi:hypothetical protein
MTEISNERVSLTEDQYHWVTPDVQNTGVLKTSVPANRVEVVGYDCTQPKISPSPKPK